MAEVFSRITSKSQTTVPKKIRQALNVGPGDALVYEVSGNKVVLRKATSLDVDHLRALQSTLGEWNSPEDAKAYDNL